MSARGGGDTRRVDLHAPVRSLDRLQRRHRGLAVPVAVVKKFGDDEGGNLAAVIAYYGFFSLFPLLMVFVAVLGFVLQGDPDARRRVLDSALSRFPVVGDQLQAGSLTGSGVALAVGAIAAILGGLSVTLATQAAFNRIHGVTREQRAGFVSSRLRGLGLLAALGTLLIASTLAAGLVSGGLGGPLLAVAGIALSLVLNSALFFAAFRLLTDESVPTQTLMPGCISATLLWTMLQAVGGAYVGHVVKGAGPAYGTFATVIGLLTWLFLGARVVVYSAELSSVLAGGLWPRALLDDPAAPGGERAMFGRPRARASDDY